MSSNMRKVSIVVLRLVLVALVLTLVLMVGFGVYFRHIIKNQFHVAGSDANRVPDEHESSDTIIEMKSRAVDGPSPPNSGNWIREEVGTPAPLDDFPWPPPRASSRYSLPAQLLSAYKTVGEVAGAITAALESCGYTERSFYRAGNGGIVLVTRVEAIAEDGRALPPPDRWKRVVTAPRGIANWIKGLFFAQPGFYRVIVFVIGGDPFKFDEQVVTPGMANAWLSGSVDKLPPELAVHAFSANDSVWSLVYEFESRDTALPVSVLSPGHLPAQTHLQKSGVLAPLENSRR